ncbi:MAG: hypothetical protein KIG85_01220 [Thiopseudomonas sp.]|nr:hypothetical protein [Thiopseudomonas sp.]
MQFTGLAAGLAVPGLIVLVLGLRILWSGGWFVIWLRATCGLCLIALAALSALLAYDVGTYREQQSGHSIAMLEVGSGDQGRHRVTLSDGQQVQHFLLDGELWGLDVQQLDWRGLASLIGLKPGYRLLAANARFLSIEQQNEARYQEQRLSRSLLGVDLWQWLQQAGGRVALVEAELARLSFIPLVEGARYSVEWLPTGLQAKPQNDIAREALSNWVE